MNWILSGSLDAVMGPLEIGSAKLSVTSSDTTSNPCTLSFGATAINGNATIDVAPSTGGGAGRVNLGSISGAGSHNKTGAGALRLSGGGSLAGGLSIAGG